MSITASDLGIPGIQTVGPNFSTDASKYGNDENLEMHWAMRTYHHAETYFNLISSVDPKVLKLTKLDDEIYTHFREEFPDFKLDVINEEDLKSEASKTKWRNFCQQYENRIEDFNFGTLLRLHSDEGNSEENTCLSYRAQFLAIEIARNREGYNDSLRFKKDKSDDTEKSGSS